MKVKILNYSNRKVNILKAIDITRIVSKPKGIRKGIVWYVDDNGKEETILFDEINFLWEDV